MRPWKKTARNGTFLGLVLLALAGCESTDGESSNVSGSAYYGVGIYDPWYYGGYDDPPDIIVTPPPRPTHPIAPAPTPRPMPMPMPSIPSIPRASVRR